MCVFRERAYMAKRELKLKLHCYEKKTYLNVHYYFMKTSF
jgi:hypothetical protein